VPQLEKSLVGSGRQPSMDIEHFGGLLSGVVCGERQQWQQTWIRNRVESTNAGFSQLDELQHAGWCSPTSCQVRSEWSLFVAGTPGASLFVYHLPAEFRDNDLLTTFSPFGNLVNAKVFIDQNSGESKGFGKYPIRQQLKNMLFESARKNLLPFSHHLVE
jgi:hypothetical protein